MTMRLVLATRNAGKVAEMRRILDGLGVDLISAADVDLPDVAETGDTFADNALLKARAAVATCGLACVADDSGLVVDALGGAPGVHSARYGGADTDDRRNLELVLERMRGVAARRARFICVAALVLPDGRIRTAEGVVSGRLTEGPRGSGGFGYDPIFVPQGERRTTAEMSAADKDALSHRGKALRALRPAIVQLAGEQARQS